MLLTKQLTDWVKQARNLPVSAERKAILDQLVLYIRDRKEREGQVVLNFICTHNSRRSQMAQVTAAFFARYYGVDLVSLSGGVAVTACNKRTVKALADAGFSLSKDLNADIENPHYQCDLGGTKLNLFSKLFDDTQNQFENFAAVMTCDHAEENCPYIPGCEQRIGLTYTDPKAFDNTPQEEKKYAERLLQIGSEMNYVFSQLKSK